MASSDNRPGFRLPWQNGNASGSQADAPAATAATAVAEAPAWPSHDLARRQNGTKDAGHTQDATPAAQTAPTTSAAAAAKATASTETAPADAPAGATVDAASDVGEAPVAQARQAATEPRSRKPTKFLADLTRAMRQAADEARASALAQFMADVERHSESARAACGNAASDARRRADDDITTLGEWETQQIARIRRETEDGITARHGRLEAELADQTLRLETELAGVRERVEGFEAEVEAFFQRLLREDDPAQFAAMAEQLPEPPAFEPWSAEIGEPTPPLALAIWTDEAAAGWTADGELRPEAEPEPEPSPTTAEPTADPATGTLPDMLPDDFAAAEAEAADWSATEDGSATTTDAVEETASVESTDDSPTAASADVVTDADQTGPWPPTAGGKAAATTSSRTQVAVVGLVSVASIANFKRLLSRVQGVRGVQVASGPDGEFLFTAAHDETVDMRSAVGGIQGFQVEVIDSGPGVVNARTVDPEAA